MFQQAGAGIAVGNCTRHIEQSIPSFPVLEYCFSELLYAASMRVLAVDPVIQLQTRAKFVSLRCKLRITVGGQFLLVACCAARRWLHQTRHFERTRREHSKSVSQWSDICERSVSIAMIMRKIYLCPSN